MHLRKNLPSNDSKGLDRQNDRSCSVCHLTLTSLFVKEYKISKFKKIDVINTYSFSLYTI